MSQEQTITSQSVKYLDYYLFFLFASEVYVNFSSWPFFSYLRGIAIVTYILWLFFTTLKPVKSKPVAIILLFILYSAVLILYSNHQFLSFYNFSKIFPSLIIFPIVVNYFDYNKAKYILKVFAIILFLMAIYLLISVVFGIGSTGYAVDDNFTRGGLNSATQFYITIITPALLFLDIIPKTKKKYFLIALGISVIFLITGMKRTTIALLIVSMVLYFIFTQGQFRYNYIKLTIVIGFFALLTSSYWYATLQRRYEHRADLMTANREVIGQEGRTIELQAVLVEIFSFEDIGFSLFGRSVFHTTGQYGKIGGYSFGRHRPIHNDFAMLFNSVGLVGVAMYFSFLWVVFNRLFKYWKHRRKIENGEPFFIIFAIIFITSLLNMYNGSFYGTGNRTIVMFFLGLLFVEPVFKKDYLLGRSRD